MATSSNPIEIFISYAHEDKGLSEILIKHLSNLKQQGAIKDWYDRQIGAGEEWEGQILEHLSSAQMILLLISPDFMASKYIYDVELKRAMERHKAGEAWVIPVILRPCDWTNAAFSKLQALPSDATPVTKWRDSDDAFLDVTMGIRRVAENLQQKGTYGPDIERTFGASTFINTRQGVNKNRKILVVALIGLLLLIGLGSYLLFSSSKSQAATDFVKTRPQSSGMQPQSNSYYDLKGPALNFTGEVSQLGVTIWKLRSATAGDDKRLLFQEADGIGQSPVPANQSAAIPARVETETDFRIGDRVFLTIESPRTGYLYVVDREQYADGTMSAPFLIYPRFRTLDNTVRAGLLLRIPPSSESPFTMGSLDPNSSQVADVLSVVVSTQQIQGLPEGEGNLQLTAQQAALLEGTGKLQTEVYEMKSGAGKAWTTQEKASSSENQRILTQEDPLPQTIYRISGGVNSPLVVKIPLRYKRG